MKSLYQFSFLFILTIFSQTLLAQGKFKIVRDNAIESEKSLLTFVDNESLKIIKGMNNYFIIPKDVTIVFGAEDGPLYDPEVNEVLMPDDFTIEVMQRFKKANYVDTEEALFDVTMDVIEHTLYHELGHALIELLEIPIIGKEEDAVDSLATRLVISIYDNGEEIALSAADLFDLEGEDIKEFTDIDFWDEHSLDFQRFYNTICMIYGSQPEKYEYLIKDLEIAEDRADMCIVDYERESKAWKKLLHSHLKDKALFN